MFDGNDSIDEVDHLAGADIVFCHAGVYEDRESWLHKP
jgi:hypothetical protein